LGRTQDADALILAELKQVGVSRYNSIGASLESALEYAVVIRIGTHDADSHGGADSFTQGAELLHDARGLPGREAKLGSLEHVSQLIENGR
jgi:hypothetical protein